MDSPEILQLAALFHDPPWKPWAITRSVVVEGRGSLSSDEIIGKIAEGVLDSKYRSTLAGLTQCSSELSAHEKYALLVPLSVANTLEKRGMEKLAGLFADAARVIAGCKEYRGLRKRLDWADRLASAIDRHTLYSELRALGVEKEVYTRDLVYVNPFTLDKLRLPEAIGAGVIAGFLREYSGRVAGALGRLCSGKEKSEDCGPLVVTVAYLLLEPVWYYVTSSGDEIYIPPADTRVPTHTVFDHANSVMAVLHLLDDGCLAVVDLAGVQAWISEARRLRDLWAASWLASYLAWRAVEPLVRRYGPGVLVSPPGRLNPFLASRLLGEWLEREEEGWVWKALGLSPEKRWPVDPVVPTRLLLAVPGEACGRLEQTVRDALSGAWDTILQGTLGAVWDECQGLESECRIPAELFEAAMRVEPPLAVRVLSARLDEAEKRVDEGKLGDEALTLYQRLLRAIAEREQAKISATGRRTGRAYLEYARLAHKTFGANTRLCTVCGRGVALLDGEKLPTRGRHGTLREIGDDKLCPYCLVKRVLRYKLTRGDTFARSLAGLPLRGITWRSVWHHSTRARYLSDDSPILAQDWFENVKKRIRDLSGRHLLDLDAIVNVALKAYGGIPSDRGEAPEWLAEAIREGKSEGGDPRSAADQDAEDVARELWPLLLEAVDSPEGLRKAAKSFGDTLEGELARELARLVEYLRKQLGSVPRRYAIVQSDGDYMGSGLLDGKIPLARVTGGNEKGAGIEPARPRDYFVAGRALATVPPPGGEGKELRGKVLEAYKRLAKRVEEELSRLSQEEDDKCGDATEKEPVEQCDDKDPVKTGPRTLPVTPAYHMSVSRSLAVVSALDRETVERLGGDIVYLGGDDALVIAAPEDWRDGRRRFPALEIAERLRMHWRGLPGALGRYRGFLAITHKDGNDEVRVLHVAPAPGAYGRSTVVYLGDAKYPMWLSLDAARSLEEAKDASRTLVSGGEHWRKDILVIASDTRGAAVLPLTDTLPEKDVETWWPVTAVQRLLRMVHEPTSGDGEPVVSARLLYSPAETVARLVRASLDEPSMDRVVAAARLIASELGQRAGKDGVLRAMGIRGMVPRNLVNLCVRRTGVRKSELVLDPGLCLLLAMAPDGMFPGQPPTTEREREKKAWSVAAWLSRIEQEVDPAGLKAGGVDYAANAYMHAMTTSRCGKPVVRLPLPLGILAAAYVYSSATSPRPRRSG